MRYEGVRCPQGVRVVMLEGEKTVGVTAPFRTWEDAEKWEDEQMNHKVEQAVRAENLRKRQEDAALEELEAELMQYWGLLEKVGLAVVRARETGEDQQVPGIRIHGVPIHVKAAEVADAHPPDDGPPPKTH